MAVRPTFNVLALCAGVGGLELGIKLAVPAARVVCYAEREAYNVAVLVARMEDGQLDDAPIWSDVDTFDGKPWRGRVDCIAAGFPCQPVSLAGLRKGTADRRWLWPSIDRIIREVRPRYAFLENVPGLFLSGFDEVLGDLAALGFDAAWGVFSAAASGAAHQRNRVFVLAHTTRHRRNESAYAVQPRQSQPAGPVWPYPAPDMVRVVPRFPFRVDRITALGNSVVPSVAARAWETLEERLG